MNMSKQEIIAKVSEMDTTIRSMWEQIARIEEERDALLDKIAHIEWAEAEAARLAELEAENEGNYITECGEIADRLMAACRKEARNLRMNMWCIKSNHYSTKPDRTRSGKAKKIASLHKLRRNYAVRHAAD